MSDTETPPFKSNASAQEVQDAVSRDGAALRFASPSHQTNRSSIINWKDLPILLSTLSASWVLINRDIVFAAIENCPLALGWASEALRSDKEVALCAVRGNGHVLNYLSAQLRRAPSFV
jgi:hypothetical protein